MSQPFLLPVAVAIALAPSLAFAQTERIEAGLRQHFEGKRVTLKLDMPATDDGVDVRVDQKPPINYEEYGRRMRFGTAIRSGDTALVTRVRVKEKHIEFQLDGGGYAGSETEYVYVPSAEKTQREKDLEREVKNETDKARKRRLEDDLNRLRRERYREDQRAQADAKATAEMSRNRIREERLLAGSRFNVRYPRVPGDISPADVMDALAEYVDFGTEPAPRTTISKSAPASPPAAAAPVGATGLAKGMSREQVERLLGKPTQVTDRAEGTLKTTRLTFSQPDQIVKVDLIDGIVIRFSIESK